MRKKKQKKCIDFFYKTAFIGGEETKGPYEWKQGEKEEYIKVVDLADGWGGIPLDVNWAKSSPIYAEALKKYHALHTSI